MTTNVLTGGRTRTRAANKPLHATMLYLSVATIVLVLLFVLWIAISLAADAIGAWVLLPIALAIGEPMRRRLREPR